MRNEAEHIRSSLTIAIACTVAGIVGLAYGYATQRAPLDLLPGLDGALTCGGLVLLLGIASGRSYRETLTMLIPIAAVQAGSCALSRASMPAVLGLEATIIGIVGIALYLVATWGEEEAAAPEERHAATGPRAASA